MINTKIKPGDNLPQSINVIIEIPAFAHPVKYEIDKEAGCLSVNRFMATAMSYPCNYGYVPQTLADDGDPLDVLVVTPFPLLSGSLIRCRPVGVLMMEDEEGEDSKILAVPNDELTELYREIKKPEDLPRTLRHSIRHFFEHYKDLEEGKWVKMGDWCGPEEAYEMILKSVK